MKNLTPKEQVLFNLLIERHTAKEIAVKLNISEHTVDYHRTKLYRKLGVKSIDELIEKYNSVQQKEMIFINPKPSYSLIQYLVAFINRKNKKFIFFSAAIIIVVISILLIWYNTSTQSSSVNQKWQVFHAHAGWYSRIDAANQELISASSMTFQIGYEIIEKQEKSVLSLTTYLPESEDWCTVQVVTLNTMIIHIIREGTGLRFKVLGDEGVGWELALFNDGNHFHVEYPIHTVNNKIIEIDVPFTDFRQPIYQTQIPFDLNTVSHLFIQRHSPRFSSISGSSTIKIFDFEIY